MINPLLAMVFLTGSCSQDTKPVAEESSPVTTSVVDDAGTSTTNSSPATTTSPATATPPIAPTTILPLPTREVRAVVAALSTDWQPYPLNISALGGPDLIVSDDGHLVISLALTSGCCFNSPRIIAGPIGGPFPTTAGEGSLLPGEYLFQQALLGSGPTDLHVDPDGFLAVGAWSLVDSGTEENVVVPYTWTSNDGTEWVAHKLPGFGVITSVVRTGGRYLAVLSDANNQLASDTAVSGQPANALLTSEDGSSWDLARELDSFDGLQRIHQIGTVLTIAGVGDGVQLVSTDHGRTWASPAGELAEGELLVGAAGALLVRPATTLWSRDGTNWVQVGYGAPAPADGFAGNWPGFSRAIFSHGDVVVVSSGVDLWVTDPDSPWVLVPRAAAFSEVNGDPPWINDVVVTADGTVVAIGASNSALQANKPMQDYMTWTHPSLPKLPDD